MPSCRKETGCPFNKDFASRPGLVLMLTFPSRSILGTEQTFPSSMSSLILTQHNNCNSIPLMPRIRQIKIWSERVHMTTTVTPGSTRTINQYWVCNIGSAGQRVAKVIAFKVPGQKKSLPHTFGPDLTWPRSKSFSKFDGRKFCIPLIYSSHINCMERSKPNLNAY